MDGCAAGTPEGAQIAVLYGDPGKAGPFVFRLKFPAGYKVAAHMHPNDYDVTVLSGTMYLGMGVSSTRLGVRG